MSIQAQPTAYHCGNCGEDFIRGNVTCGVRHPPGTCCHYGDKPFFETTPDPTPTLFFLNNSKFPFKKISR